MTDRPFSDELAASECGLCGKRFDQHWGGDENGPTGWDGPLFVCPEEFTGLNGQKQTTVFQMPVLHAMHGRWAIVPIAEIVP